MQKVIFFEGPSCAGKSTAVKTLLEGRKNTFHLKRDGLKWFISDYSRDNLAHKELLNNISTDIAKRVIDSGMDLLIESQKYLVPTLMDYSDGQDIDFKFINIEASLDTLKNRFSKRLESVKNNGGRCSNTSEEAMLVIYNNYMNNKLEGGITLNTDELPPDQVVKEIEDYLAIRN